jgi:hypothetical protein
MAALGSVEIFPFQRADTLSNASRPVVHPTLACGLGMEEGLVRIFNG